METARDRGESTCPALAAVNATGTDLGTGKTRWPATRASVINFRKYADQPRSLSFGGGAATPTWTINDAVQFGLTRTLWEFCTPKEGRSFADLLFLVR